MKPHKAAVMLLLAAMLLAPLLVTIAPPPAVSADPGPEEYVFRRSWGGEGDQLRNPQDVAVGADGRIYVLIRDYVVIIQPGERIFTRFGGTGYEPGQFDDPYGIAVDGDGDGDVYVADTRNHRVQKFTSTGTFITQWGSEGSEPGQFNGPWGIAVDGDGDVYVADSVNDRVQKFTSTGALITQWGSEGGGPGQFIWPGGIAVDKVGNVYVVDTYNHRVQKFTSTGAFITQWGSVGNGPGQIVWPAGIAVDGDGYVYVTESRSGNAFVGGTGNRRVQVFSSVLPYPDPYSGLALNGSFESSPALTEWTYGGRQPVLRANHAAHGSYALQLGQPSSQTDQGLGDAWAHTTFYVRPEWERPVLSFKYNMFVNDIMDYSDFFVAIQDGVGLNHLETVLRDGYQPCIPGTAPDAGTDLGWRTVTRELSAYKGEHIRLVFSNRNLWPGSWGIWTYIDDVRVIDAGPLPTIDNQFISYLPMVSYSYCDPVPNRGRDAEIGMLIRPDLP